MAAPTYVEGARGNLVVLGRGRPRSCLLLERLPEGLANSIARADVLQLSGVAVLSLGEPRNGRSVRKNDAAGNGVRSDAGIGVGRRIQNESNYEFRHVKQRSDVHKRLRHIATTTYLH